MVLAQRAVSLIEQLFSNSEPDDQSFNVIFLWLQTLNHGATRNPLFLDIFVMKLLACLGFEPELETCVRCGNYPSLLRRGIEPAYRTVRGEVSFIFDIAAGGLVCAKCEQKLISSDHLSQLSSGLLKALRTIADRKGNFSLILDKKEAGALHKLVYRFGVFHSGKKLKEWHNQDELSTHPLIDRKK